MFKRDPRVQTEAHPCSRGIWPTRCCWPVQETQTWTRASRPGRTGWSAGSSSAAGWEERPDRLHRDEESLCGGECGGSWRVKDRHRLCVCVCEHVQSSSSCFLDFSTRSLSDRRWLPAGRVQLWLRVSACVPAYGVELVEELIHSGVVIITLSSHQIQSSAVLGADLLQQVVRHFLSLKIKTHQLKQHSTNEGIVTCMIIYIKQKSAGIITRV